MQPTDPKIKQALRVQYNRNQKKLVNKRAQTFSRKHKDFLILIFLHVIM